MNGWARAAMRVYRALLVLYPRGFRSTFGEEMQADFQSALLEIQNSGGKLAWQLLWREFRYWPGSVWREHLWERRTKMPSNRLIDEKPLQHSELLAAMIIFILPLISIILTGNISLPEWTNYVLLVLFWGSIAFAIGLAAKRRIPRWSLPYLGFVLIIGVIIGGPDRISSWLYPLVLQVFGAMSVWPIFIRVIYTGIFGFTMMLALLAGALVLVNLFRLLTFTRGVWQHIKEDWTQLSFLLYGSLVFSPVLLFEEIRYAEISKFTVWLCLALGAWLYLRSNETKQRILALIGGATGAMWSAAISYWILIPLQDWQRRSLASMRELQWTETGSVLLFSVIILATLLAPALLKFLPTPPNLDVQEDITPA